MQRETTLGIWCERIIEAGWLIALALIPIYFNLLSARHFEPDKATTLRAIVVIMAAAALVRALERLNITPSEGQSQQNSAPPETTSVNPFSGLWERLNSVPLAIPVIFYVIIFLIATFTSVVPHTSFWGSYQRLQGTYTNLSYVSLFALIVATIRRRDQLERLITVALSTGLAVAGYGLLQHLELDPLPWRGDVITRVASTMGNSIFVAAYLIMVLPLALYRIISNATEARRAPTSNDIRIDIVSALASILLVFGSLALLLSLIKFGSVVRTADFRYWWVFPGGIMVATSLWVLLASRSEPEGQMVTPLWPGGLFLGYVLFFGAMFAISNGSGGQQLATDMPKGQDWWLWMLASVVGVGVFYTLALVFPRRSAVTSSLNLWLRTAGIVILAAVLILAIVFSQSRGPWLGMATGLFVFFFLLLWQSMRRAVANEQVGLAKWLRVTFILWIVLTLVVGGFLVAFNTTNNAFFDRLRQIPYIGRMGSLLEIDEGTGLVRRLIWLGDDKAGGAVALITSDPIRTVIGWGPESMFVAYNPFYPPSLADVESRGASPDRSHQAILDELVTKGFLGLISYFFVLISFFALAWRLMRKSEAWHWQVFFIACISIVVTHFVEGLTGIPIVSTLTMLWVTLGITVTGGMLAGHYVIGKVAAPEKSATPEGLTLPEQDQALPPEDALSSRRRTGAKGGRRVSNQRAGAGAATRAGAARVSSRRPASQTSGAALILYALIFALALGGVWWFNLSTVYADMRFHEGQAFSEQPNAGLNEQIVAMDKFIQSINSNPREDFYYLNLGRTLMSLADGRRKQNIPIGQEKADAEVSTILRLDNTSEVAAFVQSSSPLELMSYARGVLVRARELNTMNKDHYANLGRLSNFWFNWTQDIQKLSQSEQWYAQANEIAPQDITLLNERATVLQLLATYATAQQGTQSAQEYLDQAESLLKRSYELDSNYPETLLRLAELYRSQNRLAEATDFYALVVNWAPNLLTPNIERVIDSLVGEPELLARLRDAYEARGNYNKNALFYSVAGLISVRAGDAEGAIEPYQQAIALEPNNLENRRNYTLVLSDTERYSEALSEAQTGLTMAQQQQGKENEVAQFQYLVALFETKAAGGQ